MTLNRSWLMLSALLLLTAGIAQAQDRHERLIWSDEFNSGAPAPSLANWKFDTGSNGFGNQELETYCSYQSSQAPCNSAKPNAFLGKDGYLHIVARSDGQGHYTSARIKSEGLKSFQYGRIEARIKIPKGQGFWPAFWMLGDNISTVHWPACGELDIMENIGKKPDTIYGSIHGTGFTGTKIGQPFALPHDQAFGDAFHTFGLIWSPKKIEYYVDDPANVYASFTPSSLPEGAVWPFDDGKFFLLLNLAVGGDWPGLPDASSKFPQEMLVDYVRVYGKSAR
ncbi:glycoside hydrolase family 16 protein [Alloacidobacterium dinghuense]|uniref:Glycoside hydrolase family 16 protein n=1 Tax=Alloacidobacterium dinghuense TaxID=2763107 RepID=A0A7G8BIL2_9BACT|nr:glycoside hydrolase family 16 protein [Alloacidobacterium dinghuense]QNI32382.1 glycoside hydrolase family 16 protein [Alloacidobacterium dinghuense]